MKRKNPAAVELGRKGGHSRAQNLSPHERSESARRAAEARWEKTKKRIESALQEITEGTEALLKKAKAKSPARKGRRRGVK
ncbi:MAG: hypothetical protein WCF22_23510 [Candidatus Sulfotelmatobacter sp.]